MQPRKGEYGRRNLPMVFARPEAARRAGEVSWRIVAHVASESISQRVGSTEFIASRPTEGTPKLKWPYRTRPKQISITRYSARGCLGVHSMNFLRLFVASGKQVLLKNPKQSNGKETEQAANRDGDDQHERTSNARIQSCVATRRQGSANSPLRHKARR